MSYNVDRIIPIGGDASVLVSDVVELHRSGIDEPEDSFVEDIFSAWKDRRVESSDTIPLDAQRAYARLQWRGEGSGSLWDVFKGQVCPIIRGTFDAVVVWEGGDSISGLRIVNGVVSEPEVVFALKEPEPCR